MIQYVLHYFILGSLLLAILFPQNSFAQTLNKDSLTMQTAVPDSTVAAVMAAADSLPVPGMELPAFKPNPAKAVIYSAIFPGLGQIYNRKYWKLPLVYGAFMGCAYAISWNNRNYSDYSQAYMDIMSEDPETNNSWINFLPANADPEQYIEDTNFKESLKSRKDYFRRYRDLSIIITVGVYFITMIDAYVDAQLFDFDISPDLSLRVEPTMTQPTSYSSRTYGLNCSIKF
jgi:hypothetical protein